MDSRKIIGICILVFLALQESFCVYSRTLPAKNDQDTISAERQYKESIYVTIDKNFYLSGEYIKFKIYCLDANTNLPSALSKIAYLELLDTGNISLIQSKIHLDQGIGYGDLFIPSNFNSGNYILRSYTRWMKNSIAEDFFHTVIQIINPFRKAGLLPERESDEISLRFSPEGGNLVYGLKSKIAFHATNAAGMGIAFSGSIQDESDSSLLEFSSLKSGSGSFFLRPELNNSYSARIKLEDSSEHVFRLPEIKSSGYVMRVFMLNREEISIEIESSHGSNTENLYLEGYVNNRNQFKRSLSLEKGYKNTLVSLDKIDQGILKITLKDSRDQILNQRKIIVYPEEKINLNIEANKDIYKKREKVIVKVNSRDLERLPVKMDLSVSASIHNSNFEKYGYDIESYQMLNELTRAIPDFHPDLNNCNTDECRSLVDNLLLVYSGREVKQSDLNPPPGSIDFIPEYRNHIITGQLINNQTNKPEEGVMAYLSTPSMNARFLSTQSRRDGRLLFEWPDNTELNRIIVQTDYTKNTSYTIEIEEPYSQKFADVTVPVFDLDEGHKKFIEKTSKNMQIRNAYLKYSPIMEALDISDSSTFYEPDAVYYLDDYTRFPVMEEVMREYVGGVYVRKNQEGFHFKILDLDRIETFQENPLILIDGIPVFDADEIMELDPLYIKKIETVRKRFIKDGFKYSGIVSFFTYNGDLQGYQLPERSKVIDYVGIQANRKYIHPEYETTSDKNSRIPDYRNVLYWNPQLKTNDQGEATLEFYTSDASGEYEIRIEGISNDGRTAFGKITIQVEDDAD